MPHNTNKTTDELVKTNFTKPISFKSPLQDIKKLDDTFLSNVTDEQLEQYAEEYEKYYKEIYNPSRSNVHKLERIIQDSVNNIFGSYSKEAKYIKRAFQGGGVKLEQEWARITRPSEAKRKVEQAKEAMSHTSNVSLNDNDINQIDLAIKYLIDKGFKYGEDFTSNNAVSIAKSELVANASTNSENSDFIKFNSDCSDTCRANEYQITFNQNKISRECSCGSVDVDESIELALNDSNQVTIIAQS
jgi:hypothetical protein